MKLSVIVIFGILLLIGNVSALTYSYVSDYPPGQNVTYVNATTRESPNHYPWYATDSSKLVTGTSAGNGWESFVCATVNQKFNIDLGEAKPITRVYFENYHLSGTETDRGVSTFTFFGSNSSSAFANLVYPNFTGWTTLTTDISAFNQHSASDVAEPQYAVVTNTGSYRYYCFFASNNYGDPTYTGFRRIELQEQVGWIYSTPGTYYWVAPGNVTTVDVNIGGGGGSGKGAYSSSGYWIGYGGSAGEWKNRAAIAVTPGTNYTIVVGAGGAVSAMNSGSNAGGLSSGFTYSSAGGAGGLSLPQTTNHAGGDGSNGFLVGGNADAGGVASVYAGGLAGNGYSAGGGGGAASTTWALGTGGKGSDGYVGITQSGYSTLNRPNFIGTPTSGIAGTLVSFTDTSTIVDNNNMTYLWDFGDGVTSTTKGNVVHVFPYVGSYTVKLTIHTDLGDVTEEKEAYVNLITQQMELNLVGQPVSVSFHIQSVFGAPIANANVSIVGISTSTGNWQWVQDLLGIALDESAINGTSMYQTTDSLGNAEFLMVPSIKYNVSTTMAGYSFPVFYVSPHDKSYTLIAALNSSEVFGPPSGKSNITVLINATKINTTVGYVNFTFNDTANSTTGGLISLYRDNATAGGAKILIKTFTVPNSSFFNSTNVTLLGSGTVFTLRTNATSNLESGFIIRDSVVSFIGNPVAIGYFDSTILLWFAISIIIITGLAAGATAAPQVSAIACIEAWIFLGMGWLNPLVDAQGVAVVASISLATFLSAVWLLAEGRRAER